VSLVRTGVSEEFSAYIISVTRIGELRTLAVTGNQRTLRRNTTLMMKALSSSETSIVTRLIQRNIPEDDILQVLSSLQLNVMPFFSKSSFQML
jgi:hypothetical protein